MVGNLTTDYWKTIPHPNTAMRGKNMHSLIFLNISRNKDKKYRNWEVTLNFPHRQYRYLPIDSQTIVFLQWVVEHSVFSMPTLLRFFSVTLSVLHPVLLMSSRWRFRTWTIEVLDSNHDRIWSTFCVNCSNSSMLFITAMLPPACSHSRWVSIHERLPVTCIHL